jgi:hypothetical protein
MAESMNAACHCPSPTRRDAHRRVCVSAGGLTVIGTALALLVHPWFAALAAGSGLWLILAPDPKDCRRSETG